MSNVANTTYGIKQGRESQPSKMSEQFSSCVSVVPPTKVVVPESQPAPTQTPILKPISLGSKSAKVTCTNCHREVLTQMDKYPSTKAWISAGVIALCGCFCGCCIIPLCIDTCMDTEHDCPECGAHLGSHKS